MIASPMYLSTVPPCRKTTAVMTVRYSRRKVTTSSGCIRSDMDVKPRMSEKSTVMRRRPAPRPASSFCLTISFTTDGEKNRDSRRFSSCSWAKFLATTPT
jgi:hypothetical protein